MTASGMISVVLATRDRQQDAVECVRSVLEQSYASYEILVIDQSHQRTLRDAIFKQFPEDGRIRYFSMDHGGLSEARNLGVEHASGSIVAFIDDDAVARPGWLAGIAEAFRNEPQPGMIGGRIDPIWLAPRPFWFPREREFLLGLYNIGDCLCPMPEHDLPVGANMAGLRRVILEAGGFDPRFGFNAARGRRRMLAGEDTLLAERVKRLGYPLYYQPKAAVGHRISRRKVTRGHYLWRHFWEGATTIERMIVLGQVPPGIWKHRVYHAKAAGLALARFLLPRFENRYPSLSSSEIRMLALARAAFQCGVLYGLRRVNPEPAEQNRCASA